MRPALRRLWLRLHRWVGLSLGLVLAAIALTGAFLIVWKPVDQWLHPQLFSARNPQAAPASLDAVRESLVMGYGAKASFTLRPPREPGDTFWVFVHVPEGFDGLAYLDPASAQPLGQRGEHEGVVNWVFELHSSLLLGDPGRPVMAVLAATYLFLLLTGVMLWWPQHWRWAFFLQFKGGLTRALFDVHRVGGAVLGLLIAVSVLSGVWMAWKPLAAWVTAVSGDRPVVPPKVVGASGPPASLDAMAQKARGLFPGAGIGYIGLAGAQRPVRFRMRLADDPHPNGLTSVWFHPTTGEVLAVNRWNWLDAGARNTAWIYPLHTGALGGPVHKAANAVFGLALFGLGATGTVLWWRRRRRLR
jgi:uncharacterized iron-regulated membrane protein